MKDEDICQYCVFEFVRKLIDLEQASIDLEDLSSGDLLFLIGEKIFPEHIKHMDIAKEELLGNPVNKEIKTT